MSHVGRDDERPGDPAVDQAWRAAAHDQPSAQLDATIIAAARAATAGARSVPKAHAPRHWWSHWQPLAAAAGIAGLAFVIVQILPRQADFPAATSTEQAVERMPPARGENIAPQDTAAPPPARREADLEHPAAAKRAPRAAAPPPNLPSTGAAAREAAAALTEAGASAEQQRRQLVAPSAATMPPEEWARRIEALVGSGERSAAADALQAFRDAYPDADDYLAESLQPWAASIGERPAEAKEPAGITP